jgi:ethanolamine utilization protein EutN
MSRLEIWVFGLGPLVLGRNECIAKAKDQRPKTKMQLARVIGTVVATVKNESLQGRKLLVVQTVDKNLEASGKPMVAVDSVGAGIGELVFWCRGKEASFPFKREDTPTDCTIVGIVDSEGHVSR